MTPEQRKAQVRRLWDKCFPDTEAFKDLYFNMRYTDDNTLTLERHGQVVSALQILQYPLTMRTAPSLNPDCQPQVESEQHLQGLDHPAQTELLTMGYISGACTHPDYRRQGLMGQLIGQALKQMRDQGMEVSTLIPQDYQLSQYYERLSYAVVTYRIVKLTYPTKRKLTAEDFRTDESADAAWAAEELREEERARHFTFEKTDHFTPETIQFLNQCFRQYPSCVLHPTEDLRVVEADLRLMQADTNNSQPDYQLTSGNIYVLRHDGCIVALAVVTTYRYDKCKRAINVNELQALSPEYEKEMGKRLCYHYGTYCLPRYSLPAYQQVDPQPLEGEDPLCYINHGPLAMLRIVNAPQLMTKYARLYPRLQWTFDLSDDLIPENNGRYIIREGQCQVTPLVDGNESDSPKVQGEPNEVECLTPPQLAHKVFDPLHPHFSLMLD